MQTKNSITPLPRFPIMIRARQEPRPTGRKRFIGGHHAIAPRWGADAIQHRPGPLGRAEELCAFGADDWGATYLKIGRKAA
jgi:hypothetical protein